MMILGIVQRQKNDLTWLFPHYSVRFCARAHLLHARESHLLCVVSSSFSFSFSWSSPLIAETVGDVGGLPDRFAARSRQPALHG
jgi:hypothetical protein